MTANSNYSGKNIKVLEGLEPVKERPGMYTNVENPNHIIQEVIDNAIDEALGGYATKVSVKFDGDYIHVSDNGRGIPVDPIVNKDGTLGAPAAEVVFTKLHAGGKFDKISGDGAYKFSGGLHGVGVSVTNALSLEMKAVIKRGGKVYSVCFENGDLIQGLQQIGKCPKDETGTTITARPNPKYFDSPNCTIDFFTHYLKVKAALMKGVEVSFQYADEEPIIYTFNEIKDYFLSEVNRVNGPDVYWLNTEETPTPNKSDFLWDFEYYLPENSNLGSKGEGYKLVMGVLENGRKFHESYVNLIPTGSGGTHERGLKAGLFEGLKSFMNHWGLMPTQKITLDSDDLWSKVSFVLSARILDPVFKGQVKESLSSASAVKLIEGITKDNFELWLNENKDFAKVLAAFVIENAQKRTKSEMPKPPAKRLGNATLPGKLTDCVSKDNEVTELFICEGDSAGGGAKMARDKDYQAIFPIRGKIQNAWEMEANTIFSNEEIKNISIAIGLQPHGIDDDVDMSKLRYGKIATLCDADVDGRHIESLLSALFMRHFPQVVLGGHFYICRAPLFRMDYPSSKKNKSKLDAKAYIQDEKELEYMKKKITKEFGEDSYKISRFKGLGEMEAVDLWDTTMNPENRVLIRLDVQRHEYYDVLKQMDLYMAKGNADERKAWMAEFGNTVEADA